MSLSIHQFKEIISNPFCYLFHLHTWFSDGELSVEDYFVEARKRKIQYLFFTEHVREHDMSYDFSDYVDSINYHSKKYEIKGFVGVEAKVMYDGRLNCPSVLSSCVDIILLADHGFNKWDDHYKAAMTTCFSCPYDKEKQVRVWAHPLRKGNDPGMFTELALVARKYSILIEYNELSKKGVVGSDIHTREELDRAVESRYCVLL
jgi:histidinol phosphatase-like PHP family hydrolase